MTLIRYTIEALGVALTISGAHGSVVPPRTFNVGQQVNTTSGIIRGHAAATRSEVSEYLGIPFAQPPIGDLRFAAPEPYRSSLPFNASSYGLMCMSNAGNPDYSVLTAAGFNLTPIAEDYLNTIQGQGNAMGEDCLTLNVWTKPQVGEKAKAVLFFIHGGGFQGGSSHNPFLTGQYFADDEDVVVISTNYRTNVFGFPGLQPSIANVEPNAGLLDQRLAIEWARDNVAAFGGDPKRITLFGQSAGSTSISTYAYAYADDPIAHGLITQSGTADSFGTPATDSTASFAAVATVLGCNTTTTTTPEGLAAAVSCIRAHPASAVSAAAAQVPPTTSALGTFAPTADNKTAFAEYATLTQAGSFARLPRLHGSNAQDGNSFAIDFALLGLVLPRAYWAWHTLAFFGCPTAETADALAIATGSATPHVPVPAWRYVYAADYPNLRLAVDPSLGAYHGAELNTLFGTSEALGGPDTPAEAATGRYMRAAWAAFAKDPVGGLVGEGFGWPALPVPVDEAEEGSCEEDAQVVVLGLGNATEAVFQPSSAWDSNCTAVMGVLEALGGVGGLLMLAPFVGQVLEGIDDGDVVAVGEALLAAAQAAAGAASS
ncbi:carboxylesterase [Diaporthe helianthi]|uniref:Carboxylic ester hydrolase n=1 Tax=Diaporthe helianthi TaxID=158607 RepID=A0A2P5HKR3_DIAHE|nr:carboxylesterase [Diaporthe helianthi]